MALSGYSDEHDDDALAAAKRAARRAGMSLSEWLETVVVGAVPRDRDPPRATAAAPKSTEQSIAEIRARLDAFARRHGRAEFGESELRMSGDVMRRLEEKLQALERGNLGAQWHSDVAERREPSTAISAAAIEKAISEISDRQGLLEQGIDNAMAGHSDRIDHRIEKVAERLERHIDDASAKSAIHSLEEELRGVITRLETNQPAPAADLDQQLSELVRRLDDLPPRVADELSDRLESTARRIDTATRAEIDSIRAEMREIAQEIDRVTRSGFEDVVAKLAEFSARMDERPPIGESRNEGRLDDAARSELAAIRSDIRSLASQLDGQHNGHSPMLDEFRELAGRVEAVIPHRLQDVEHQLEALVSRISAEPAGTAGPELSAIERQIDRLAEQIEATPAWLHDLHSQLDAIAELLGQSTSSSSRDDLLEIERQINALAERVETRPEWVGDLERQLGELGSRSDQTGDHPRHAELEDIERQISRLAERLESENPQNGELAALERQISDLIRYLETTGHDGGRIAGLDQDLAALKSAVESGNEHNQSTLTAVHETLNRIVDRLEDLDREVDDTEEQGPYDFEPLPEEEPRGSEDARASQDENEQLEPDDIIGRIEAVTRSFRNDSDDHTPLAPGSGRPGTVPAAAGTESDPSDETRGPSRTSREDFIAAARRAAHAATAESATADAAQSSPGKPGLISRLRPYRRPLIVAGAVAILIIGAIMLVDRVAGVVVGGGADDDEAAVAALVNDEVNSAVEVDVPEPSEVAQDAAPRIVGASQPPAALVTTASTGAASRKELPKFEVAAANAGLEADAVPSERESARPATEIEMPPEAIGSLRLREAAAEGNPVAQFEVASRFAEGKGVAQDLAKAAYWFRLAAAQGLAPAQYRLGSLYEKGRGVPSDVAMARSWYQRAAEQGNRAAMHNLAVLHAEGANGDPDYEQAALWFRQSAEYGLKDSQYNLAILHARGLGVEQSLKDSYRWFAAAAEQGDAEAAVQRDEISRRLDSNSLAAAKLAFQSWQAKPLMEQANRIAAPEEGWDDPAPPAMDAAEMVREAQSLLYQLGYAPGPIDGETGPMTRQAILEYQRAEGLLETGEVTLELLDHLSGAAG